MNFTCPLCKQPIEDITGCHMIEDGITAAIIHPHCYEQEVKRQEAARAAKLAAKQAVEREKLVAWNNLSKPSHS